jgi:hypothetical protein
MSLSRASPKLFARLLKAEVIIVTTTGIPKWHGHVPIAISFSLQTGNGI